MTIPAGVTAKLEVPAPKDASVLSDEHRQLGYLGLYLKEFNTSRKEMTNALERFAGKKLAGSLRQFLDHDPRLPPDMV